MLPPAPTEAAYDALDLDSPALAAAAAVLAGAPVTRVRVGSLPVFGGADRVVKLYPPCFRQEAVHEARWLARLDGALPAPTPRLLAQGEQDGWAWVRMSRLRGQPAADCWDDLSLAAKLSLSSQLGELLSALHSLSLPPALALEPWPGFVSAQRAGAVARHRRLGLSEAWAEQIPDFLAGLSLPTHGSVPLHTEIMRAHVFVSEASGRWRITGLLDFEPSTLGAPGYEFASVGLFWTQGDPALMGAVCDSYGARTPGAREMMGWAILHRYANLRWYLGRMPSPEAQTLSGLAERWFGQPSTRTV